MSDNSGSCRLHVSDELGVRPIVVIMLATLQLAAYCGAAFLVHPNSIAPSQPAPATRQTHPPRAMEVDKDVSGLKGSLPIDTGALERERREDNFRVASREEMAEHLPAWASDIMLDDDATDEYEAEQARRRAKYLNERRVDDRSWDALDIEYDDDASAGEGAGMAEFTPEELAEDYSLPLETVVTFMLSIGVDPKRLRLRTPVKGVCTAQQQGELLAFLGSTDPIAAREELCESTLEELAEAVSLSAEQLLRLCEQNEIPTVLGEETRIPADEERTLLDAVEREQAFGGL